MLVKLKYNSLLGGQQSGSGAPNARNAEELLHHHYNTTISTKSHLTTTPSPYVKPATNDLMAPSRHYPPSDQEDGTQGTPTRPSQTPSPVLPMPWLHYSHISPIFKSTSVSTTSSTPIMNIAASPSCKHYTMLMCVPPTSRTPHPNPTPAYYLHIPPPLPRKPPPTTSFNESMSHPLTPKISHQVYVHPPALISNNSSPFGT